MSAPTPATDRTDLPAASDGFIRGLSQAIGGPVGEHAVPPLSRRGRFWTAQRIILALVCLTLAASWVQKSPCQDGDWQKNVQYTRFCYTDVLALYYAEGLNEGKVPYRDHPVEYPVVTGYFMGALGLPVHALGDRFPEINQGRWFYNANALVLSILAVASAAVLLALRRRRPWDAAIFALSPILLVTATVNWDLLAIALAMFGLYAWARRQPLIAGLLLGLGGAAKLWPLFILGPLFVLALRSQRMRAFLYATGTAVLAWLATNLPVAVLYPTSWSRFFELNDTRPIDWGTLWYIGRYLDGKWNTGAGDKGPFQWLSDNIPALNNLSYALTILACAGIGILCLLAPPPPPPGPARLPRGRRLPHLQQGVVAAVRPLAPAAGRAGPPALGRDHSLDGRGDRLLRRLLRRTARRGRQAGDPRGHVRAGLEPAADHTRGPVHAGDPRDLAARTRRGPPHLPGRPGRRRLRRCARRLVDHHSAQDLHRGSPRAVSIGEPAARSTDAGGMTFARSLGRPPWRCHSAVSGVCPFQGWLRLGR
ncbi:uncharacterized protein DUF2029 [Couchioplanes caeruleus]|uniref:Uncharacterized protein DUF2029 n=1 Tax=Couchioplanes caeruleus TaxID=56438 RepID=A0A3N1GLM4_9ACTN|nr:uncharacterized protein DUF2029 [Couchioplanes caeruleus]